MIDGGEGIREPDGTGPREGPEGKADGVDTERRGAVGRPARPPVGSVVEIDAPAKVNLVLRVLRRDPATGYHDLETVFQAVDLSDRLRIEVAPGDDLVLEVEGAEVGPAGDNLVTRAARMFLAEAGLPVGLRIRLAKHIPPGTGLGGGSSDAAATLRGLGALLGEPLSMDVLRRLAGDLGSDVPFFLGGSPTALAWGRGERLRPLPPLPVAPVVLVLPDVHVATGEAYERLARHRARTGASRRQPRLMRLEALDWDRVVGEAVNDFEEVVPEAWPRVGDALAALDRTDPEIALLSGSGSAVFGVFADAGKGAAARGALADRGWTALLVRTLDALPVPAVRPATGTGEERA